MLIANPIYHVVFKRLLEDNPVAEFVVGTILGCEVLSLEPSAPERTKIDVSGLTVYRMDFAATIQAPDGGTRRVIIEMQKAKALSDVQRFREYLGGENIRSEHPIIAIYFLGFNLQSKSAAFTVDRNRRDLETGERCDDDDYWVDRLTHPAYFIQTLRTEPHTRTKLGMLLSVFAQEKFVSRESKTLKDYHGEPECPEMKALLAILQYAAADAETRREMDEEASAQRSVERMFRERDRQREEDKRQIAEHKRQIAEHKREREEAVMAINEYRRTMWRYAMRMKDDGVPSAEISQETGLTVQEIESMWPDRGG